MSRSPVHSICSIHIVHGHVVGHKYVNSLAVLSLFLLPHFIVVPLFDAPSHKATLKVFAYLLVSCQNLDYGHSHRGPQGDLFSFWVPTPRPLICLRDEPAHQILAKSALQNVWQKGHNSDNVGREHYLPAHSSN